MGKKLYVGNLAFDVTQQDLEQLFAQSGVCESVAVITDRDTGQSRGFGFAEMATSDAADEAIRKFNGYSLGGRTLKVELSKPSAPRNNDGGSRSGGGYRSGSNRW